jgi:hypothetical protein
LNLAAHSPNRWAPGAKTEPDFFMLQGENVAMTVDKRFDHPNEIDAGRWAPKARRQGERTAWTQPPQAAPESGDELLVTPLPLTNWPRVFPGI